MSAVTQEKEIEMVWESDESPEPLPEFITDSQRAALEKAFADVEIAEMAVKEAAARVNAAVGARRFFVDFLMKEYGLVAPQDIDIATGKIIREQ